MNDNQHLNFNCNSLTISTLHNSNNMESIQITDSQQINTWKRIISSMTKEQIETRSLLVGMSEPTEENEVFQKLLTEEYLSRKNK